jgi:putative SOS response-associated peptidase YedK
VSIHLSLHTSVDAIRQRFGITVDGRTLPKRYNIVPGQKVTVLAEREGTPRLGELLWGLVPADAHHPAMGTGLFQVREESLLELRAMRTRLQKRRCAILVDGFFLWQKSQEGSQPWYFHLRDDMSFPLAAVWEAWHRQGEESIYSCAVVTTRPNELVAPIHHRMPVILSLAGLSTWLDRDRSEERELLPLCAPYPAEEMDCYKVSRQVDNERNDTIEVIQPQL